VMRTDPTMTVGGPVNLHSFISLHIDVEMSVEKYHFVCLFR